MCYGPVSVCPSQAGVLLKRLNQVGSRHRGCATLCSDGIRATPKEGHFPLVPGSEFSPFFAFFAMAGRPSKVCHTQRPPLFTTR